MKTTTAYPITYRTEKVDGINIFFREGGDPALPVILFLHGFPSSSHMYRDLLPLLADSFHLIAPDYPGFGLSDTPGTQEYNYTFDQLSVTMEHFIDKMGFTRFHLFIQDYGSPIGFRIALRRPEFIQSLIIQNANAYMEGLGPMVHRLGALEAAGDIEGLQAATLDMMSYKGIKNLYLHGAAHSDRISPESYLFDHFLIERTGNKEIQAALSANYNTNFPLYADWQAYFRKYQPPALILWGKNDGYFTVDGATAYQKDLQHTELHVFEAGHFAIEEYHDEMAVLVKDFLRKLPGETDVYKKVADLF